MIPSGSMFASLQPRQASDAPAAPADDQAGCKLMDEFAVIVQIFLAALAFSTLIYKRQREDPRRPLLIWGFDVSKQVIGAGVIHILNIALSYINGEAIKGSNPCVWYFLNILIDTTIGVFILWCIIQGLNQIVLYFGIKDLRSGEYGEPPLRAQLARWSKQCALFIVALIIMKAVVLLLFSLMPFLVDFGRWSLAWSMGNTKLQVVFVMLIFPLIMNIVQFWLVDQIVKKKTRKDIRLEKEDEEAFNEFLALHSDEEDEHAEEEGRSHVARPLEARHEKKLSMEYEMEVGGHWAGHSSSRRA
ncbi:uncharacterized protein VTP21DRAFT_7330 [Calcarisporiella thermophila]|uniref:uncharacterized protein n=1 Tax=Calcarisporiella thermophila TaxID=911321 RepID=UPI003744922F